MPQYLFQLTLLNQNLDKTISERNNPHLVSVATGHDLSHRMLHPLYFYKCKDLAEYLETRI